jgi:hypothetical protein
MHQHLGIIQLWHSVFRVSVNLVMLDGFLKPGQKGGYLVLVVNLANNNRTIAKDEHKHVALLPPPFTLS